MSTPFWKSDSKILPLEPLFDDTSERLSSGYFCFYPDLPLFDYTGYFTYMFGMGKMAMGYPFISCFYDDYFYCFSLSLEENTV